ncbi:MAG TPA: hypothetical protein VFY48_05890 [Solirubrobacterales bacterium]|nr:hypothetical protein [Solirubrobacterales bacterium]
MKRKTTVVTLVLGAVAAFVLPAFASAGWKHHSTPVAADTQIGLTGNVRKQGGLGGIECQVTMRVKLLSNQTTGTAETFVPHPTSDTTNCKGLGGLAFCQIHNLTPQAPNWAFHTVQAPASISLTTQDIVYTTTGGFCPQQQLTTTAGTVTLTPNQPNTFSSFAASGSLQVDVLTNGGVVDKETMTIAGTLAVESPNANTYSI